MQSFAWRGGNARKINSWYLGAITGAARGVTVQTGSRAGVHARHTGPWDEKGCGVEVKRCIPGLEREALAAIGVPALSTGVADTRELLQESQPAGQARHSLKGEELK